MVSPYSKQFVESRWDKHCRERSHCEEKRRSALQPRPKVWFRGGRAGEEPTTPEQNVAPNRPRCLAKIISVSLCKAENCKMWTARYSSPDWNVAMLTAVALYNIAVFSDPVFAYNEHSVCFACTSNCSTALVRLRKHSPDCMSTNFATVCDCHEPISFFCLHMQ